MMKCSIFATPYSTVSMISLTVNRVIKAFTDDAPLQGEIFVFIKRSYFICSPAKTTVVDNYIFIPDTGNGIQLLARFRSGPDSDISYYNIVGLYYHSIIHQTNTITRCTLTCNGYITIFDIYWFLQLNITRNPENNYS